MNTQKDIKGYKITNQYGTYFITCTIVGWVDFFTRRECAEIILESLKYCENNKGLIINAYVIMPSHMHLIVRAKENSDGLSAVIRDFKKHTSKQLIHWIETEKRESRADWLKVVFRYHAKHNKNNKNYQIWKQDNQPKELIHPKFTRQKLDYIHNNPVNAGIVRNPSEYVFSSAYDYENDERGELKMELIDFGSEVGYVYTV